ncbi:MAG: metallophosphatase family protein [Chitinispirillia bacterium]|nr:metallophosphatase family protein [Chitinispirillia bacterium]MCL2241296.1 metallophosphatase family protein [Chitinispirillia bacterium]
MKYAVISDIHGNLEALNAVLKDIRRRRADKVFCLGDIVGYYPNPRQCIELISAHAARCVAGNHDYAAIERTDTSCFTYFAFSAMEWTKQHLTDADKDFLSALPLTCEEENIYLVHSSPCDPERFSYVFPDNEYSVIEAFSHLTRHVNFIGHTHCPSIMYQEGDRVILHSETSVGIEEDCLYLINVGSVGQPRDFDSRSCYALYDTDKGIISLHRVSYNYRVTQKKVRECGLHAFLAERLEKGR